MEITRYVVSDEDGNELDTEYDTLDDARSAAQSYGDCAVIERTYVYDDSQLVWTPNGGDTWPPEANSDD